MRESKTLVRKTSLDKVNRSQVVQNAEEIAVSELREIKGLLGGVQGQEGDGWGR